jgi:hypothetical protein
MGRETWQFEQAARLRSPEWPQVKAEFTKAIALRSQIRRAGWFN